MNKEETFLMVSLEEEKAKKLAQVISNDTCRRILGYLANKKATESELAAALGIPLSTVHYNLKHLVENRLVEAEEFHYSKKGKEVLHYGLTNKYVIISPKGVSETFKDKLKSIIPAVAIVGAIAFALQLAQRFFRVSVAKATVAAPISPAPQMTAEATQPMLKTVADTGMQAAQQTTIAAKPIVQETILQQIQTQPIWLWIVMGAILFIIFYFLFEYIRKKLE
ncbi:MAG: helix-turn-helix domain-containing protein [Candidatus Woesearchaeota archaeon]|nr:helix-turn-helix domain-containing protein [Candidatus Woesearchaeota archaeon]